MHCEEFERNRLDPIYEIIKPYSEMARNERYFLNGIIRYLKPKKILEVGVSHGGGSSIILNAIQDIEGSKLYSVDYSEEAYKFPGKPSGFLVEEKFPELMDKWQIFRGGDISCYIEEIGGDIDLLVLDTVHLHPWETLNFLCVMPFMKRGSWVVLHDISYFLFSRNKTGLACRLLFGHVVSDEKISPVSDREDLPANIGAFKISDVTFAYADNLFGSLLITWESEINNKDFESMKKIIEKYYTPEQYKNFCSAFEFQNYQRQRNVKFSLIEAAKVFFRMWQPRLYNSLKKVKKYFIS